MEDALLKEGRVDEDGWIEVELEKDYMRNRHGGLTIRFKNENRIDLPCSCNYGQEYPGKITLIKDIEFKGVSGKWRPYPVVVWVDSGNQLQTIVLFVKESALYIMDSPNGVPDAVLYSAAEKEHLFVESAS